MFWLFIGRKSVRVKTSSNKRSLDGLNLNDDLKGSGFRLFILFFLSVTEETKKIFLSLYDVCGENNIN